jgi:hypothetical protein
MKNYLAAVIAVLALFLVWDNFLVGMLLGSTLAQIPGLVAEVSKLWETVGDLCSAMMLTGVYARVRGVYGVGAKNGAIYGVYAGLLINFPTWLLMTVYAGWPYALTWTMTIAGTLLTVVAGAIIGTVYQATGGAKTA